MFQGWFGILGGGVGVGHAFTCFGECICRGCFLQVQDPKSLLETSYLCLEMRARPAYFVSKLCNVFQERLTSCYVSLIVTLGLSDLIQTIVHMQSTITSPVKNWAPPGTRSLYPRCWSVTLTSLYCTVRLLHFSNSISVILSGPQSSASTGRFYFYENRDRNIFFNVFFHYISQSVEIQGMFYECSQLLRSQNKIEPGIQEVLNEDLLCTL